MTKTRRDHYLTPAVGADTADALDKAIGELAGGHPTSTPANAALRCISTPASPPTRKPAWANRSPPPAPTAARGPRTQICPLGPPPVPSSAGQEPAALTPTRRSPTSLSPPSGAPPPSREPDGAGPARLSHGPDTIACVADTARQPHKPNNDKGVCHQLDRVTNAERLERSEDRARP